MASLNCLDIKREESKEKAFGEEEKYVNKDKQF